MRNLQHSLAEWAQPCAQIADAPPRYSPRSLAARQCVHAALLVERFLIFMVPPRESARDVALVVPNLDSNSVGRAYALSLALDAASLPWRVLSLGGEQVWKPLNDSAFAARCHRVSLSELKAGLKGFNRVVAVKPLPDSFGAAIEALEGDLEKLVVDIDDPDLELRLGSRNPLERLGRRVLKRKQLQEIQFCNDMTQKVPVIVSNPALQRKYGGVLIPHVRPFSGPHVQHQAPTALPYICFVGTSRGHKGLALVRDALRRINRKGLALGLVVTSEPPRRTFPWEVWVGEVSFAQGREILSKSVGTAILITKEPYKSLQLPAKAIDALSVGIPVIHSSTLPLEWALSGHGIPIAVPTGPAVERKIYELLEAPQGRHTCTLELYKFRPEDYKDEILSLLGR